MQYILLLLLLLACPVGMGLVMWLMMHGNKQQAPGQAERLPAETYSQPLVAVEPPTVAKSEKRATPFNLLGMCLNWKVVAGLAVVGGTQVVTMPVCELSLARRLANISPTQTFPCASVLGCISPALVCGNG